MQETHLIKDLNAYARDVNGRAIALRDRQVSGLVVAADTALHRFSAERGTNTGARTSGPGVDTFELTGLDTVGPVSFAGYVLEITTPVYAQKVMIRSNTAHATAPIATLFSKFPHPFPDSGNADFLVYPLLVNPLFIKFDKDASGTLTLYREAAAVPGNHLTTLAPGDSIHLAAADPSTINFVFSTTGAQEQFEWRETTGEAASSSTVVPVDRVVDPRTKFPAVAGTPEVLAANGTFARAATLLGKRDATTLNSFSVLVGKAGEAEIPFEIRPGRTLVIRADPDEKLDLNDWSVLSFATGDGVLIYDYEMWVPEPSPFIQKQVAPINVAVSGNNMIIAAPGLGLRIVVESVILISDGTVDVRFEDGAGGTAFTGQFPLEAREGFSHQVVWPCTANTLFNMELSAAVNVHGSVTYSTELVYA